MALEKLGWGGLYDENKTAQALFDVLSVGEEEYEKQKEKLLATLTEEERKNYKRWDNLEKFWKSVWKELPENVKSKLDNFRKMVLEWALNDYSKYRKEKSLNKDGL